MRGRLLKTLIGLTQHAGLTTRNYVTSPKCPFPLLLSAGPPSHLSLLHRMHLRMIHATAFLERHRKSKSKRSGGKSLRRHHGRHQCKQPFRSKHHPCKFKKCFCVGPTYKEDNPECRRRVFEREDKKCPKYDYHGESGQGPYRRQ